MEEDRTKGQTQQQPPQEPPTVREPPQEPEAPQGPTASEIDVDGILAELEAIGKKSPEEIRGMYHASREVGQLSNFLGQSREEIRQLRAELARMGKARTQPTDDWDQPTFSQPVDLKNELKGVLKEFVTELTEEQRRAQEQWNHEVQKARGSRYYALVGDDFERALMDPEYQQRFQAGELTPSELLAEKALEKLTDLTGKLAGRVKGSPKAVQNVAAPHVEQGGTHHTPGTETSDQRREKLRKLQESWSGTDEDIDKTLDVLLGPP